MTGIKWPASRLSYKTLSPEVRNTWCFNLVTDPQLPSPGWHSGTTRGEVRASFYLPAPEVTTCPLRIWAPETAQLDSTPVISATLNRLLPFFALVSPFMKQG